MIMMDEASKRMMDEWMLFLPQGAVRRRPKKVPLSFSALARGALPPRRAAGGNGAREEMMMKGLG